MSKRMKLLICLSGILEIHSGKKYLRY